MALVGGLQHSAVKFRKTNVTVTNVKGFATHLIVLPQQFTGGQNMQRCRVPNVLHGHSTLRTKRRRQSYKEIQNGVPFPKQMARTQRARFQGLGVFGICRQHHFFGSCFGRGVVIARNPPPEILCCRVRQCFLHKIHRSTSVHHVQCGTIHKSLGFFAGGGGQQHIARATHVDVHDFVRFDGPHIHH